MSRIKIFLVFHKTLDERLNLNEFSAEEIQKWFVPYAVNIEKTPKEFILKDGTSVGISNPQNKVVVEYDLPHYDPMLQARGFMETSAYIHIEKNALHEDVDLIGICQYDMRWTKRSVKLLRSLEKSTQHSHQSSLINRCLQIFGLGSDAKSTVYAQIAGKLMNSAGEVNGMACAQAFNWDYLLKSYNQFFNTQWQATDLINQPLTLWQTYLMQGKLYAELAQWLNALAVQVEPWANEAPYETHWGVLGGYTERAESLFMALRHRAKEINIRPLYLEHDDQIPTALGIGKDHYGT